MKNKILLAGLLFFSTVVLAQDFQRDIPMHDNGKQSLGYRLCKMKSKGLNLKKIENGVKGQEIRVWYDNTRKRVQDVLVLREKNGKWTGTVYAYTRQWNTFNETERIRKKMKIKVVPKSGWDVLIPKLEEQRIADLVNMDDIKGLNNASIHGKSYTVEYANDKKYRFYNYHTPERFYKEYPDVESMMKIARILDEEFGMSGRSKGYRDMEKFMSKARKKRIKEAEKKKEADHEKK